MSNSDSWRTRKIVERGTPSAFTLSVTNFHEATINSLMYTCSNADLRDIWKEGGEGGEKLLLSRIIGNIAEREPTDRSEIFRYTYIPVFFIIHGIVYS